MTKDPKPFVHPTAIVEDGAQIGPGSRVWHHSHVRCGAVVGSRCSLGKNVYVDVDVDVGDGVKIQNNVSVYGGVKIEDDVFVGPSVTFTNDLLPRAFNADWVVTRTLIRRGSSIGANATVVCGHIVGEFAMVAAGATVTSDVADYALVGGTPARHLGWVCKCGRIVSRETTRPSRGLCDECHALEELE